MLTLVDVYKFIDQFEQSGKQIASVAAQTGTGKSTTFPEGFYRRGLISFVIQPTIVAASNLVDRMKKFIPEEDVGAAFEGVRNYTNSKLYIQDTKDSRLVYSTAGHMKNIILRFGETRKPIAFSDYLFVDEAHTGSLEYDTILYLYAYLMKIVEESKQKDNASKLGLPKMLLITATPGVYPFKDNMIYKESYPGAESFPVEIKYHHRDYKNLKGKEYKDLFADTINIIIKTHESLPVGEDESDKFMVFAPGKKEINDIIEQLRKKTHGTIIIPLYSGMSDADKIQWNIDPPKGMRLMIISSNAGEASITINNISYVFDTLVEKTTMESRTGGIMLQTVNIPKSSAQQRKGRTGRTRPGTCYRMCTKKFYDALPDNRLREIERISPDGMILDLLSRNLKIEEVVTDNVIEKKTLEKAKQRLATIGLLTDDTNAVTQAGNYVKNLPLSPRVGQFYWLFSVHSSFNPYIGAVLAAVIETHDGGFFYIGEEDPPIEVVLKRKFLPVVNEFNKSRYKTSYTFNVLLILHIIETFRSIEIPGIELKGYCAQNNLNNVKVKACIKLIKLLATRESKGILSIGRFDVDHEISKASDYLYQSFSDLSYNQGSKHHTIKSEVDSFIGKKDQIPNNSIVIPLGSFETANKIYVSLYHVVRERSKYKVSIPMNSRKN